MPDETDQPKLTAAGAAVRNPLSVIAMFVLLVEVIATVTLVQVTDKPDIALPIAWFTVAFPTLIAVLFFFTIWFKHQGLYSPYEYRSDDSFLTAMRRLQRVEARQEADDLNPQTSDLDQSKKVIDRLLAVGDVRAAVKVGRTFLKAGQGETAAHLFSYALDQSDATHVDRYNILANLGYAQLQEQRWSEGLKSLESAIDLAGSSRVAPWHQFAAAYAHHHLSSRKGDEHDQAKTALIKATKSSGIRFDANFFRALYPEIAKEI